MIPVAVKSARLPSVARYEFGEPIGSGGVGTVYRATDRTTGTPVAIKVLRTKLSDNPTVHQRFVQEFRAATQLEHPNIVRALEMGLDGNISYLVYELVNGADLGDMIRTRSRLPEADAVKIVTQIAQALHYAHQRNVIHRDVKPDNILVMPDGRAKLTDFGLAKDFNNDLDLTKHSGSLGTPNYMAPEQFGGAKEADGRCDIYGLGATLFAAVTGEMPFHAKTPLAILTRKERESLSARAVVPELSPRLDAAVRSALQSNPELRPASCLEFFKLLTARPRFDGTPVPDLLTPSAQTSPPPVPGVPPPTGPTSPPPVPGVPPGSDRRACVRHLIGVGTCGVVDTAAAGDGGPESEEMWPLVIRDVSAGGIGVMLARRFEPGTELTIECLGGAGAEVYRIMARVVRVEPASGGHWVHGCAFPAPLDDAELANLIKFA
jgi:serine/threonine protein kinase